MGRNLILSSICINDLVSQIASEVTGRIYRDLNISGTLTNQPQEPDEKLSRTQLAKYLDKTLPTIDRYKANGVFPFYQTGRTIYFKKSEVDKALKVQSLTKKG